MFSPKLSFKYFYFLIFLVSALNTTQFYVVPFICDLIWRSDASVFEDMKPFCGLLLVFILLSSSNSANLLRKKRFFDSLWPSEEVKKDVQNGFIYAQLPPGYLHLLPGVNDHKMIQRRSGQPPTRFVHPTRMAMLMPPHQQLKPNVAQPEKVSAPVNTKPSTVAQLNQQATRIIMKPSPSITLKTKDQALPDIHKTHRFVPLRPVPNATQKPFIQPFNTQQQLPIKKSFDIAQTVAPSELQLSVKTANINQFYNTKEFQNLLAAFKINVDISKLPPISDVMEMLGTENGEETLNIIREAAQSAEGMELIKSYLDENNIDDEFYNYEEDIGTGEIQVDGSEDVRFVHQSQPSYSAPNQETQSYTLQTNLPTRATTTGTLTGAEQIWWKPSTWFNSSPSTRVESLQKDAEILKNIVPKPDSAWGGINYITNFLTPPSSENVPINPPLNTQPFPRRIFLQQPVKFTHQSVIEDTKTLPTIQMTEAQFQDLVKRQRLTPMNLQHSQNTQPQNNVHAQREQPASLEKFQAPINVQSVRTGISQQSLPLPSTYTQFEEPQPRSRQASLELPDETNQKNRRNFISASEPQRSAPYDFTATGRVHKANPEEVMKKSRSLAETIEGC